MLPAPRVRERTAPADNLKSSLIPPSGRSMRCRTTFDRECHRPGETNPLRQHVAQRGHIPYRRIARPDRRKVMRFFLAWDLLNRVRFGRERNFWGAQVSGVLVAVFCRNELCFAAS